MTPSKAQDFAYFWAWLFSLLKWCDSLTKVNCDRKLCAGSFTRDVVKIRHSGTYFDSHYYQTNKQTKIDHEFFHFWTVNERKKFKAQHWTIFKIFPCFGIFFPKSRLMTVAKMAYIIFTVHISFHIGKCYYKLATFHSPAIFEFMDKGLYQKMISKDPKSESHRHVL